MTWPHMTALKPAEDLVFGIVCLFIWNTNTRSYAQSNPLPVKVKEFRGLLTFSFYLFYCRNSYIFHW